MTTARAKQAGKDEDAQEFDRKTTKYWVHPEDIPEVKRILHNNLPEFRFSEKVSRMVQSVYFDNAQLRKYHDRLMLVDKGMVFRYRWYGQGVPPLGFMEQKIRRLGWLNDMKSVKRRCKMSNKLAARYVSLDASRFTPTAETSDPALSGASLALALELQQHIVKEQLRPVIRTAYVRSCYQKSFDSPLRVSFDEDLQFTLCANNEFLIMDAQDLQPRLHPQHKYSFPHGVLEIKVRLLGEGRGQLPPWCQGLIDRKLITPLDKFSKFNTAVAIFFHDQIDRIPYYLPLIETHKPAPKLSQDLDMTILSVEERDRAIDARIASAKQDLRGTPSLHMQVERTYLKWLQCAISLSSFGGLLFFWDQSTGWLLILLGFVLGIRSVFLYHKRSYAVRRGRKGNFRDIFGPVFASVTFIACMLLLCFTGVRKS